MSDKLEKDGILLLGIFKKTFFDQLNEGGGKKIYVMEGRPSFEAGKVTSRELIKRGIKPTLIADNMAGFLFYKKLIKEAWVSYQTSDEHEALCQIGGSILAVLGKKHNIPVRLYPSGKKSMFMGKSAELLHINKQKVVKQKLKTYTPLLEEVDRKYFEKIYE
jgi:methylthioribose-1-phosphate isomerase